MSGEQFSRPLPTVIRRSTEDAYSVYSSKKDLAGRGVVRYTRTYKGLRVYGGDLVIRTDAKGAFAGSSVGLAAPLSLDTKAKVGAARTKQVARSAFRGKATAAGKPELFVDASSGSGKLSWETVVTGRQGLRHVVGLRVHRVGSRRVRGRGRVGRALGRWRRPRAAAGARSRHGDRLTEPAPNTARVVRVVFLSVRPG